MSGARATGAFAFEVAAPPGRVFPLFGAWAERAWAGPSWRPRFLHPDPPRDEAHAVFTLARGGAQEVWVNTAFDPRAGRIQYVYVVPGVQAVTIDLALAEPSPGRTRVEVTYRRTALDPGARALVQELAAGDRAAGPEWQAEVSRALGLAG